MGLIFSGKFVQGLVGEYAVMKALDNCVKRVEGGQANAAVQRWFGITTPAGRKKLRKDLSKFKSIINLQPITVSFEDMRERNTGTNASAWPGSVPSIVPGAMTQTRQVFLDSAFSQLPSYLPRQGGTIDSSDYNQSRFNTLIHELSHAILSTDDEELASGAEAYGAEQAEQLVGEDTAKAYNNAENWGIFVEACGVHETS